MNARTPLRYTGARGCFMSGPDLCSTVFVLHTQQVFPAHLFLGRAVYKLFLLMLGRMTQLTGDARYAELASELHDLNAALPFTASDLFQSDRAYYWFRLTGLEPRICDVLQRMVEMLPGQTLDVPPREDVAEAAWSAKIEAAMMAYHDWAGQATYTGFVQDAWARPAEHQITLDFMTPTALRSVGVYRPFPEPSLVFKLLYERLLKLDGMSLPFQPEVEYVEACASYLVEVTDYQIVCAQIPVKQSHVTAFYGWAAYDLHRDNDAFRKRARTREERDHDPGLTAIYTHIMSHHAQYACLLNLLADFAFYSGVGLQTGQGMGMVRRGQANRQ